MATDEFPIFSFALRHAADLYALVQGDEVAGLVAYVGNEIDIFISDQFKGRWGKGLLRELFYKIFEKHDHATARIHVANEESRKFAEGIGFKPLFEEDGMIRYAMLEQDFRFRRG